MEMRGFLDLTGKFVNKKKNARYFRRKDRLLYRALRLGVLRRFPLRMAFFRDRKLRFPCAWHFFAGLAAGSEAAGSIRFKLHWRPILDGKGRTSKEWG